VGNGKNNQQPCTLTIGQKTKEGKKSYKKEKMESKGKNPNPWSEWRDEQIALQVQSRRTGRVEFRARPSLGVQQEGGEKIKKKGKKILNQGIEHKLKRTQQKPGAKKNSGLVGEADIIHSWSTSAGIGAYILIRKSVGKET